MEQSNDHNKHPFVDMDSDYLYIEFDETDKVISKDKNPWVDEIPQDNPQGDILRKEIENILKEAEEAKRIAELQNLLQAEVTHDNVPDVKLDEVEHVDEIAHRVADSTDEPDVTASGDVVNVVNDGNEDKDANNGNEVNDGNHASRWKKMMSSEPIVVATNVVKEVIFAVSMFSVASYLTLQFLDMQ